MEQKQRIIQEYVPGKQVTLMHLIASPMPSLYMKLGLVDAEGAIGIFTITPTEAAMIAVKHMLCDQMGFDAAAEFTRS